MAAIQEREATSRPYPLRSRKYSELPTFTCMKGKDQFDCMQLIADKKADLIQLDPGMGYTGGQYYNLMPIMAEKYTTGPVSGNDGLTYKAVAVVKRSNSKVQNIDQLAGTKACFPGVGQAAGWVYPMSTLMESGKMPVTECNVPVKSAASFFGSLCAPDGLARYYNPFGNNPATICQNCAGDRHTMCTVNDPYAGYHGAFDCMHKGAGDVAFLRDITVLQATSNSSSGLRPEDYKLLCTDGTTASVTSSDTCNWGIISSNIIVTSEVRVMSFRTDYKQLLELLSYDFGVGGQSTDIFELFSSSKYNDNDLMFSDETKQLVDVGERNNYFTWVGAEHRRRLLVLNMCPEPQARWCVISKHEMQKCEDMIMALAAKNLKPDLNCIMGLSVRDCMEKIRVGDADLITLDAADVYVAGKYYNLIPIAAEDYSGYDTATYFAVAISRRTESYMTLFNLKNRRSCHSGVMTAAGWIIPVDKLIETGQIQIRGCNSYYHLGQFFSKSCVPGVLDSDYNTKGTNPINLCESCASGGQDRCLRNDEELYFGNSGAFRCLVEYGGDVAFAKHTTVRENTGSRNQAQWARNRRSDDYELLCTDGTRKDIDEWANCNLGEIPSNAIVTADFKTAEQRAIYWTLINYAQQFFASDSNPDFPMFASMLNHKDLMFQDSTVRLVAIKEKKQNYRDYLGASFIRAMERNDEIDCITSSANQVALVSVKQTTLVVCLVYLLASCLR
ncbi:hypothetical protein NP493_768g01007 [Ridgeia piscesae]|uniref:Transferrin-like domain-containing protein n=1 Tax=Ridgeia piscesae TaxID=27915 RepID=A0AAD9NLZ7_RIDPI|nr:hypothetical protein NP493_768g01007 [Ridgeia piscesae]